MEVLLYTGFHSCRESQSFGSVNVKAEDLAPCFELCFHQSGPDDYPLFDTTSDDNVRGVIREEAVDNEVVRKLLDLLIREEDEIVHP